MVGGDQFLFPCTVTRNGYATQLQGLLDTGAGGITFTGRVIAQALVRRFHLNLQKLSNFIPVRGYNGIHGVPASHYFLINLTIEGRTQRDCPVLVLDSLAHDIIIGRNLMRHWRIKLNMATNLIEWPEDLKATPSFTRYITYTRRQLLEKPSQVIRSTQGMPEGSIN